MGMINQYAGREHERKNILRAENFKTKKGCLFLKLMNF